VTAHERLEWIAKGFHPVVFLELDCCARWRATSTEAFTAVRKYPCPKCHHLTTARILGEGLTKRDATCPFGKAA
jgi:hypothetical protein